MNPLPVAVTGLGVASAIGTGAGAFAAALRAGAVGVRARDASPELTPVWAPLPEATVGAVCEGLDDERAGRARVVLGQAPPATAAAVACALEAATDARLCDVDPRRIAVVVAGSNLANQQERDAVLRREARRVPPRHAVQMFDSDAAASVTEALGTRGEAWTAGAASASGGLALAQGRRAVLSGDADAVIVVGVPMLLTDADLAALSSLGALCRTVHGDAPARSCRPFDSAAAGFVYGQGAAALVLEPAERARARGVRARGTLRGAASRSSACRSPAPDTDSEAAAMREALRSAGLEPRDVSAVNAHATASAPGDAAEAAALRAVFGPDLPLVNATKALTGHCLTAAGVLEAAGVVLQLEGGWLHPNPNLTDPIDDLPWVGPLAEPWSGRCALSNSFGFGGLHTSLIFTAE